VSTEAAPLDETPTAPAPRQVSPQVSAVPLSKFRTDLAPAQAEIVDAFKQQCPGFAVMRKLVLNFRSPLRVGKLAALRRWMKRAAVAVSAAAAAVAVTTPRNVIRTATARSVIHARASVYPVVRPSSLTR
jgi:hypothetical protein